MNKLRKTKKWKEIANCEFELITSKYNFYITFDKSSKIWVLDVFDEKIEDNSSSYIDSFEFDSLVQAKNEAENFI